MLGYKDFDQSKRLPRPFVRVTSIRQRGSKKVIATVEQPPTSMAMSGIVVLSTSSELRHVATSEAEKYIAEVHIKESDPESTESEAGSDAPDPVPTHIKEPVGKRARTPKPKSKTMVKAERNASGGKLKKVSLWRQFIEIAFNRVPLPNDKASSNQEAFKYRMWKIKMVFFF